MGYLRLGEFEFGKSSTRGELGYFFSKIYLWHKQSAVLFRRNVGGSITALPASLPQRVFAYEQALKARSQSSTADPSALESWGKNCRSLGRTGEAYEC
jgi:hypothetical protein